MVRSLLLSCLLVVGAVTGCGDDGADPPAASGNDQNPTVTSPDWLSSATTAPGDLGSAFVPGAADRTPLAGFGEVAAVITAADGTECEVCLLAAVTPDQRSRGLMEVTDEELGGYDGMVFVFEDDAETGFWMRNTRLPLSIAYFDADGVLVSQADMEPCPDTEESCPVYPAGGPFRYALEVPQGLLDEVGVFGPDGAEAGPRDAVIELTGTPCPVAAGA